MKHAIILCAGSARRFFRGGESSPKCLLPLTDDETILDRLLRQIHARGYGAILGTGCGYEQVATHAAQYENVRCVFNPDYATTNSIVTLWRMRDFLTDDTVLINGDLVVGDSVFDLFSDDAYPQVLVKHLESFDNDTYRVVFDDEYSVKRMGKELTDEPGPRCAAFLGISRVGNAEKFLREIENLLQNGTRDTWPTTAYKNLIGQLPVRARDIGSTLFFDVDTPEEHEAARASVSGSR